MAKWFLHACALLVAVTLACSLVRADDNYKPIIPPRPLPQDKDNNGIYDVLDQEIADMIASGRGDDVVSVMLMLSCEPSELELQAFTEAGGNVTTELWKYATYGFGGDIQYDKISTFAQNCQSLVFIEKVGRIQLYDPIWPIPPWFIDQPSSEWVTVNASVPELAGAQFEGGSCLGGLEIVVGFISLGLFGLVTRLVYDVVKKEKKAEF